MASLTKRCRHSPAEREECGCTWYVRHHEHGRDVFTRVGPDRAKAERALRRFEATAGETMDEAIDAWLELKASDPAARPNSVGNYRSRATHIRSALGKIPVASLRPKHVSAFVAGLQREGYAPSTVAGIYASTSSILRHARRRGVISDLPLPVDGPGISSAVERRHDLTLEEVEQIIARTPGKWGKVAEVVYLTGLRWGEVVAVEPDDIEGDYLRVRRTANRYHGTNPPKTRAGQRIVPLSPRAKQLLLELPLPVGGAYEDARRTLLKAMGGLHRPGMGWHTLRHAHASLLDSAGVSLREAAARMGHGHRFAETLGYRVRAEGGDAAVIDAARRRAGDASGGSGQAGN